MMGPWSGPQCPFISMCDPILICLKESIFHSYWHSKFQRQPTWHLENNFRWKLSQVLRYEVHNISVCSPSLAITKLQIHLTLQQSVNDHKIFCITQNSWAHFLHSIFGTSRWPGVSNIKYITMLPSWFSQTCIYGLHQMNFNHRQIENQDMTIL